MIYRFFHADRDVTTALARAVQSMPRVLLITQLQGSRTLSLETRTPFKEILECAGEYLDLLVLIDEGRPEGMWRDPMGDLCEQLLADRKDAAAATSGYLLTRGGKALTWFRKALWDPLEDAEAITAYLADLIPGLSAYERPRQTEPARPRPTPTPRRTTTPIINPVAGAPRGPRPSRSRRDTPVDFEQYATTRKMPPVEPRRPRRPPPPPEPPPEPPPIDPYQVLGLTPGVTFEEVKKTWRALLLQYHPDKVAHLAPEFREMAENKTRDINAAFAELEKALKK